MGITSLDVINDLSTRRAEIINIPDFDSKKLRSTFFSYR